MEKISGSPLAGTSTHFSARRVVNISETNLPADPQVQWENPEGLKEKTIVIRNNHASQSLTVRMERVIVEGGGGIALVGAAGAEQQTIAPNDYGFYNSNSPAVRFDFYIATEGPDAAEVVVEVSAIA